MLLFNLCFFSKTTVSSLPAWNSIILFCLQISLLANCIEEWRLCQLVQRSTTQLAAYCARENHQAQCQRLHAWYTEHGWQERHPEMPAHRCCNRWLFPGFRHRSNGDDENLRAGRRSYSRHERWHSVDRGFDSLPCTSRLAAERHTRILQRLRSHAFKRHSFFHDLFPLLRLSQQISPPLIHEWGWNAHRSEISPILSHTRMRGGCWWNGRCSRQPGRCRQNPTPVDPPGHAKIWRNYRLYQANLQRRRIEIIHTRGTSESHRHRTIIRNRTINLLLGSGWAHARNPTFVHPVRPVKGGIRIHSAAYRDRLHMKYVVSATASLSNQQNVFFLPILFFRWFVFLLLWAPARCCFFFTVTKTVDWLTDWRPSLFCKASNLPPVVMLKQWFLCVCIWGCINVCFIYNFSGFRGALYFRITF